MQNEPKFRKSQMNVNKVLTTDYEKMDTWLSRKNEPKTNPNEPKSKKAKMNVTNYITMDYRKNDAFAVRKNKPNSNPIQTQTNPISEKPKMNATFCLTKVYENESAFSGFLTLTPTAVSARSSRIDNVLRLASTISGLSQSVVTLSSAGQAVSAPQTS